MKEIILTMSISACLAIMGESIKEQINNKCDQKFYDGEGNEIPFDAVELKVKSHFTKLNKAEQERVDYFFY